MDFLAWGAALGLVITTIFFSVRWQKLRYSIIRLSRYLENVLKEGAETTTFIPSLGWDDESVADLVKKIIALKEMLAKTSRAAESHQERLQTILGSMADGVMAVSTSLRLEMLNRAAEQMLKVTEEEVRGKYLVAIRQGAILERIFRSTMAKKQGEEMNLEIEGRTYQLKTAPLTREGEVQGAVGIFRDMTQELRLEQARRDLVANLSHELRTPLTSIKGLADALMDGAAEDPRMRERFLRLIQGESERMYRLIKETLDLSRLESGMVVPHWQEVNLISLLADVVGGREPELQRLRITIDLKIEPDAEKIWADPGMVWQILHNLLDNAIQHSPQGGEIDIQATREGNQVRVAVKDQGPGIEPEHLSRIFERFYRVEKDRSRRNGGTGLGLAIVKHLVELQQGEVSVVSRLGEGSTFAFTLPVPPKGVPPEPA